MNNKKHCSDGIVTLKNGTKKIGPWAHNIAVMPVSFHGCRSLVTIAKDGANWWTDHHDYDFVQLDVSSPASRALKRGNSNSNNKKQNKQQQNSISLPLAVSTTCSTVAVAATVAHTDAKKKNVDQRRNVGSSKRTKVHHPPKIVLPRGTSDTTNNNEDKKTKKKKKEKNSVDVAAHDGDEEERLKNQPQDGNDKIVVIDVDAVAPDDVPSSASASARVSSSSSTSSPSSSSSSLVVTKSYIYSDAILSEKEELDFPLHAAVKFGDEECVLEELEKIKESSNSNNGSSNGNGNGNGCVIDINTVDSKGRTALDLAALTGQLDIVKKLRCVPGSKFCYMSSPRMKLIADRRSKDVEKYLKEVKEMVE
jgi:ankyrin repeat protein